MEGNNQLNIFKLNYFIFKMIKSMGLFFVLVGVAVSYLSLSKPESMPYGATVFLGIGVLLAFLGAILLISPAARPEYG